MHMLLVVHFTYQSSQVGRGFPFIGCIRILDVRRESLQEYSRTLIKNDAWNNNCAIYNIWLYESLNFTCQMGVVAHHPWANYLQAICGACFGRKKPLHIQQLQQCVPSSDLCRIQLPEIINNNDQLDFLKFKHQMSVISCDVMPWQVKKMPLSGRSWLLQPHC